MLSAIRRLPAVCCLTGLAVVLGHVLANAGGPSSTDAGSVVPREASAEAGQRIAEAFCSNCHLIGGEAGSPVVVGIPSLKFIANKPGQSGERIESVLIKPHAPMPDMKLSYPEIRDLIAYLETLRTDKSGPSLLPVPPAKDDPKLPKPG